MRFLFLIIFISSCSQHAQNLPTPKDTLFKESDRNWEYLYAKELDSALLNQDDPAFFFFWPYYLQERHKNKIKKLNDKNQKTSDIPNLHKE